MIYFIRDTYFDAIKIGTTVDVDRRLGQLGRQLGEGRLVVLGVMDGSKVDEGYFHALFGPHRIGGEWFRAHDDLLLFIRENARPWVPSATRRKVGRPQTTTGREGQHSICVIKGSPEYGEWLARFVAAQNGRRLEWASRVTLTGLIADAIECYAEHVGFDEEPPPRIGTTTHPTASDKHG